MQTLVLLKTPGPLLPFEIHGRVNPEICLGINLFVIEQNITEIKEQTYKQNYTSILIRGKLWIFNSVYSQDFIISSNLYLKFRNLVKYIGTCKYI